MKRTFLCGLMVALLLLVGVTPALAVPVISIDLDPGTGGIQTALTVDPGDSFTIDVVVTGDGVTAFDLAAFDVAFNDLGAVLGLGGGTGMPTAGALAGTAPGFIPLTVPGEALDLPGGGIPVAPGGPLVPDFFPLAPGFAGGFGGVALLSPGPGPGFPDGGPFPTIGAGVDVTFFSLTFDALAPGTSTVLPSTGGGGGLEFFGGAVQFNVASATVTVTPEPSTMLLLGSGLAGLGFFRIRSKDRKKSSTT